MATADVLVIDTLPVVVKPAIAWVAVPVMTIGELPALKAAVPVRTKFPPRVSPKLPVARVEPVFIVYGIEVLKTLASVMVIVPVLPIITPPVAANGVIHSTPESLLVVVLYWRVALPP